MLQVNSSSDFLLCSSLPEIARKERNVENLVRMDNSRVSYFVSAGLGKQRKGLREYTVHVTIVNKLSSMMQDLKRMLRSLSRWIRLLYPFNR